MGYSLDKGWRPPYPETTGYIIPTFLEYQALTGDETYRTRAMEMGSWELSIQRDDGSFPGGESVSDRPIVFDTGQIIFGMTALAKETQDDRFVRAAQRAGDWLLDIQDDDGCWRTHTYNEIPHAYNSRVAWALCTISDLTGDPKWLEGAKANIRWVLSETLNNGFARHMNFFTGHLPLTHTIVYTLRGLFEASCYFTGEFKDEIRKNVATAVDNMLAAHAKDSGRNQRASGLAARFDEDWQPVGNSSCLTGNCQLAILLMRMEQEMGTTAHRTVADNLVTMVKQTQFLAGVTPKICGGVAGSYPLGGEYQPYTYPNWAAKFLADALIMRVAENKP